MHRWSHSSVMCHWNEKYGFIFLLREYTFLFVNDVCSRPQTSSVRSLVIAYISTVQLIICVALRVIRGHYGQNYLSPEPQALTFSAVPQAEAFSAVPQAELLPPFVQEAMFDNAITVLLSFICSVLLLTSLFYSTENNVTSTHFSIT